MTNLDQRHQPDPAGTTVKRLVVVGASLAGLRAVETARKLGFPGEITLIGDEPHLPYNRPALSKTFLESVRSNEPGSVDVDLLHPSDDLAAELDVRLLLGTGASGLNADDRVVTVGDEEIQYDRLIIATGARARRLPQNVPGSSALGVHVLRTIDDARALAANLETARHVVIIGAGFIGAEVASGARSRGVSATIVECVSTPLERSVGSHAGAIITRMHHEAGTTLLCNTSVAEILTIPAADAWFTEGPQELVRGVRLGDGTVIDADLVVTGIGAVPATGWLRDSGVDLDADGGILCNADLSVSVADVFAAGDVAHVPNDLFDGDVMRPEHWTNAAEQGALAARSALGLPAPKHTPTVPYFWSDIYGHRVQFVGTPRADHIEALGTESASPVVLYRRGDRIVGALMVNRPRDVMKVRQHIVHRMPFSETRQYVAELLQEQPVLAGSRSISKTSTERSTR